MRHTVPGELQIWRCEAVGMWEGGTGSWSPGGVVVGCRNVGVQGDGCVRVWGWVVGDVGV